MTNDQFETLVGKLEAETRQNPSGYEFRVLLLALLGDAYLVAILLLIVALLAGLIASLAVFRALAVKLIVVAGIFLWMILKALWVRIDPPEGTEVRAGQAPELMRMIDELRHRLGAPRFHHVLITDDFNAGVVQSPRLGIFGWHRNYLLIGLPLMKSLDVEQFRAVLAHEFGHLAKGHGRVSNWIYRQRLRWSRLMDALESSESRGRFLFKPFLDWFAPYFNAYSFPLARANEYEADATAVSLTSARAAAEALTGITVINSYLAERYWPQIHRHADDQPQPGFTPYSSMGHEVAAGLDDDSAAGWLKQAMARQTTSSDTHPALHDRLEAINETPRLALPDSSHAADRLLGESLGAITESFDRRWRDTIAPAWEEHHREVQENRRSLADLNAQYECGADLTLQETYDRARLTESVGADADAALEQFRVLHERVPDDPVICLDLGARLLARDDESGCPLVERAMRLDEDATLQGCEVLRDYYRRNDRMEEAREWHRRLSERSQVQLESDKERNRVTLRDKFEHHGLSDDALADLQAQLRAVTGLRSACFVKKAVRHFVHRPCYVLGFSVTGLFQIHSKHRASEVLKRIQESVRFPGETMIINVDGDHYRFGRTFRRIGAAKVL
jgi:Zn-dependent protease with chaperone function